MICSGLLAYKPGVHCQKHEVNNKEHIRDLVNQLGQLTTWQGNEDLIEQIFTKINCLLSYNFPHDTLILAEYIRLVNNLEKNKDKLSLLQQVIARYTIKNIYKSLDKLSRDLLKPLYTYIILEEKQSLYFQQEASRAFQENPDAPIMPNKQHIKDGIKEMQHIAYGTLKSGLIQSIKTLAQVLYKVDKDLPKSPYIELLEFKDNSKELDKMALNRDEEIRKIAKYLEAKLGAGEKWLGPKGGAIVGQIRPLSIEN